MYDAPKDKYKMFRNFMANELEITREDIERWTKEAVSKEVTKKLDDFNFGQLMNKIVTREYKSNFGLINNKVAYALLDRITMTLKNEEDNG